MSGHFHRCFIQSLLHHPITDVNLIKELETRSVKSLVYTCVTLFPTPSSSWGLPGITLSDLSLVGWWVSGAIGSYC